MAIWNKYANTAARQHGKPGREIRPKGLTLDMHAHVAVPRVAEIVTPHLKNATDPLVSESTPETQALMAKQAADIRTRISTTDERFSVMDEMGVDMQLVCPAPPQIYYYLPVDVGVQAARALNDGIAEYVSKHSDRLVALGGVPMQDGNEAAKELERCMKTLGFKGVEILTNVNGKELSDPAFAPFWKKAEELDALVLIHPTGFTQPQRFARFYFNNVIGNPLDTTMALHYLIFDGVFERHPKLRVLAVHGQHAKLGMAFEDAVEDQVVQRHRGVERIADHVVEVKARETLRLGETGRVDQHQRVELLGFFPERRESRIGQFLAVDVGKNLDALEAERLHAALEFLCRLVAVLHRHAAERNKPVAVLADIFGDAVVEGAGGLHADIDGQVVIDLRRRWADELHVDAHLVHDAKTLVRRAYTRAYVGRLLCHQSLRLGRRVLNQRIGGLLEMRRHDLGDARHRDMRVHIDGETFRPRLAPRLAVFARRGVRVFVPDRHRESPFRVFRVRTRRDAVADRRRPCSIAPGWRPPRRGRC